MVSLINPLKLAKYKDTKYYKATNGQINILFGEIKWKNLNICCATGILYDSEADRWSEIIKE